MGEHFRGHVRLVDGVHAHAASGVCGERDFFLVAEIAVGLELDDLALVLERAVHRIGLGLEHLLHDRFRLGIRPSDRLFELFFLLRTPFEPLGLQGGINGSVKGVEIV